MDCTRPLASSVASANPGISYSDYPEFDGIASKYQRAIGCIKPQGQQTPYSQLAYQSKCANLYNVQSCCLLKQTDCLFVLKIMVEQQPVKL
jgi:hypothetical protein